MKLHPNCSEWDNNLEDEEEDREEARKISKKLKIDVKMKLGDGDGTAN